MYSFVIPLFNSEKTIHLLVAEILRVFQQNIELILVNDCSSDNTHNLCIKLCEQHPFIKYISLSENTGEYMAVLCGLHHANGNAIAILDDDLQNPPSEALKLFKHLENNYDVVYAQFSLRHQSLLRRAFSWLHNLTASLILKKPLSLYLASFKVLNKTALAYIKAQPKQSVFIDRIILSSPLRLGKLEVNYEDSKRGYSNYPFLKLLKLFGNFYTNTYPVKQWVIKDKINFS